MRCAPLSRTLGGVIHVLFVFYEWAICRARTFGVCRREIRLIQLYCRRQGGRCIHIREILRPSRFAPTSQGLILKVVAKFKSPVLNWRVLINTYQMKNDRVIISFLFGVFSSSRYRNRVRSGKCVERQKGFSKRAFSLSVRPTKVAGSEI